ncbi:MAG: hypothetical protein H6R00_2281 [Proteobacteria bacterium]|nr:hypothetical protein [Pseudomonadota bacterium]
MSLRSREPTLGIARFKLSLGDLAQLGEERQVVFEVPILGDVAARDAKVR